MINIKINDFYEIYEFMAIRDKYSFFFNNDNSGDICYDRGNA